MTIKDFAFLGIYFCGLVAGFLLAYGLRGIYQHWRDWVYGDVCGICGRTTVNAELLAALKAVMEADTEWDGLDVIKAAYAAIAKAEATAWDPRLGPRPAAEPNSGSAA